MTKSLANSPGPLVTGRTRIGSCGLILERCLRNPAVGRRAPSVRAPREKFATGHSFGGQIRRSLSGSHAGTGITIWPGAESDRRATGDPAARHCGIGNGNGNHGPKISTHQAFNQKWSFAMTTTAEGYGSTDRVKDAQQGQLERSRDVQSGHPGRARKGILAAIAAAFAVGLTLAPIQASSALAFNASDCPSTNLNNTDIIRKDAGKVDFGDDFHFTPPLTSNGAPLGNAIVCWANNRSSVYLKARYYNDRLNGQVRAVISSYRGSGANPILVRQLASTPLDGNGTDVFKRTLEYSAYTLTTHDIYRLRVSLQTRPFGQSAWTEVGISNVYYGS